MKKRVAILGAGYIAKYHCDAIKLIPGVQVIAVCDLNLPRAQQLANSQGIDRVYKDLDEMLAREKLDCVHVLTPPAHHFEPARRILAAGVAVFLEKPLCTLSKDCNDLMAIAIDKPQMLGVSHNFHCAAPYQRLHDDLEQQRLGKLDQIDIVWQKPLPQLKFGPFDGWLFSSPKNILFEVAPHSLAHAIHLVGELEQLDVSYGDPVTLPGSRLFYRRWEIRGCRGKTHVRILLSFIDAFTQHYIDIRGRNGHAHVEFERNAYTCYVHSHEQKDLDHFKSSISVGWNLINQACKTLFDFVLAKGGFKRAAGPFADSIYRAVAIFYESNRATKDVRIGTELGTRTVQLAERIAAYLPEDAPLLKPSSSPPSPKAPAQTPTILVTGGTGFIGKALIKRLCKKGHEVRVMTRSPAKHRAFFDEMGAEVVKGDMLDFPTVETALEGIRFVYHLARGDGPSWQDYEISDFEPTKMLAKACLSRDIELIYTSSIIVHAPANRTRPIKDQTPPHLGRSRTSLYARTKSESEWFLQKLHHCEGLKLVIARPGIVIGPGCTPLHAGIGSFPYSTSICSIIGDGRTTLPIVLIDDCADAMARIVEVELEGAGLSGSSFNIVDDPYLNAQQYIDNLELCSGCKVKRIFTPPWRVFLLETVKWSIKKIGRNPDVGCPSLASIKGFAYLAPYDNSFIKDKLGWQPTTDIQSVIRKGIEIPVKQFID
ncbi:MAG: Gfo/Idh/MocA family oxidoreductase [Anaerolineaceae bacterium]|nr:Gfo/Idh/MocA family oxidoreductase [Anaerolineaceae bacterium]